MRNEPTRDDSGNEPTHDSGNEPTHDSRTAPTGRLSRRALVVGGASSWLTISVAGCTGDGTDDDTGDDDTGDDEESTTTHTVTNRTTQTETDSSETSTPSTTDETDAPTPTPTSTPSSTPTGSGTTSCPSKSLFPVGSPVGFLVGIFRTDSGELVDPSDLERVAVRFPDADISERELSWNGPHADYIDNQWGGKLANTDDLSPGEYTYDVVMDDGAGERLVRTGQFTLVDVSE